MANYWGKKIAEDQKRATQKLASEGQGISYPSIDQEAYVSNAKNFLLERRGSDYFKELTWRKRYEGKPYSELASILQSMTDGEEKQWLADYADLVDREERRTLDLQKADREVQELDTLLKNAEYLEQQHSAFLNNGLLMLTQGDAWRDIERRYEAILEEYGSVENLRNTVNEKRKYMAESKQLQEELKAQADHEAWVQTVRDSGTIQKELDALNERMAAPAAQVKRARWESFAGNVAAAMTATSSGLAPQAQPLVPDPELAAMREKQAALEKELRYSKGREYAALMNNADFAEKSAYVPTEYAKMAGNAFLGGSMTHKYDYINKDPNTVMRQTVNEQRDGEAAVGMGMGWLQEMTAEEVAVYNYLHATEGEEKAEEFIAFLRPELTARQRQNTETALAEASREAPVAASAVSVLASPMRGIGLIGQGMDLLVNGSIDQNAGYNQTSYMNAAIRNEVSQMAQEKWGPAGSFAYQTAMSMGDFLMNAAVGGSFVGVPGVTTAIMGSGAAADTVMQSKDRGLSDGDAFTLGIVAGLAEAMTERFSLEALLNPDLLKSDIGVYMLTNSLTEGSEEVASSIINLVADITISQEKSEWQNAIRNYQDQGYSEGEAYGKALAEQAASLGMDFLGGAISGGIMSGATSAQYYASTKRDGRAMGRRGLTDSQEVQQILDAGHNAEKNTAAHAVAGRLQKKVDAGRKLSAFDKGQLYQSNPQVVGEAVFGKGSVQLANVQVQGIDKKHEDWKEAERLARITGKEIRFYNGDPHEDGQFDPKSGEIYINVDRASEHQVAYVFAHELTHSTELADSYIDLLGFVRGRETQNGRDWNAMIGQKKAEYEAAGHPLETDRDAEKELVAVYVQNNLLTNEMELQELFWYQPTIGQKILNWFDRMLAKLPRGEKSRERLHLESGRQKVLRAFEESQKVRQEAPSQKRTMDHQTQHNQQRETSYPEDIDQMSDEEWDDLLTYEEHEAAASAGEEELGRQYSLQNKSLTDGKPVRLSEDDLHEYLYAGGRRNKNKLDANAEGKKVILTSDEEISEFISDAIDKKAGSTTVAYGKVTDRLADDVFSESNGKISIQNYYMELIPTDLQHAFEQHSNAKEYGDIDLSREDFERIPEYLDTYTELLYAIRYASGNVRICVSKELPSGHILIIETVSKSRGAIQFKNAIGVSKQKYEFEYLKKYKKRAETSARGSESSNISLRDSSNSINSIDEVNENVNRKMSLNNAGRASAINKRDVARDLRAILSRGGDPKELQRYVDALEQTGRNTEQNGENRYQNGQNRYQTGANRNGTAREILAAAHSQGQSVEEYLRWNPEQFERNGKWRPEALEAIRMEQGRRQYSLTEETEENTNELKEAESQAGGIRRENLPTKARNYLHRTESRLLNAVGEALSVPRYARYQNLQNVIQEISDTFLADGTIPEEKWDELFDKAYAEGIVSDRAFYDQYKEIKDHLRSYGVTLSERDRADIADYEQFRKRTFGSLRILNEGGVPVDTAYGELHTMAPELFPDDITHPADQLVRMFDVAQSIAISQKNLDDYYGPKRDEFRKWAKNDFNAAVADAFRDLKQVVRYSRDLAEKEKVPQILTVEEAEKAYEELKKLRWEVEKAQAKNLLTEDDQQELARLLRGEISLELLDPNRNNVKGITALYEAKRAYESQCKVLAAWKRSVKAKRLEQADGFLETAGKWKDKRAGILYARETMRRNIMDIIPDKKLAERIAEVYFESVHISEAKATRFKTEYRDRVRELNLSTKVTKGNMVSEAHAVQLLGEAMDNIRVMEKARGRMKTRDGKTLTEWRAVVDDLWMNNPGLDKGKIERAVEEFRKIYDELFQRMNRVRVENGYEPVNYRQGYFPHFQPGGDGITAFFGKALGINTQVDALPTTINGLTHTFKPGIQWFGNAQERLGFNTAYDAVEGFDKYIEGVASVIFQTENIQNLRALATQVRYRTSDEGIRKQVDAIRMDDRLTEEEKQREISAIYEHGKFSLSNFVAELDEYTNLLANKKSKYDRSMEHLIGRRVYTLMKVWENRVGANMIAGNISSALTNIIPLTQAGAQLDSKIMLQGMWDTLMNLRGGDGIVRMSNFLTNRRGSDVLVKSWQQTNNRINNRFVKKAHAGIWWIGDRAGFLMELIDNFTSESIVRAAYLQNRKRGLSETEAMNQADIFASGVMADRSKGAMPTLFESRNPLFKAFTQFQLEVNNQFSEVFKDLPRNHREKGIAQLTLILLKYFLGAWMYNELFEKVMGRRSALDPIDMLNQTVGDLTGYEIPNLFEITGKAIKGEEISLETEKVGIGEAVGNLATSALSELPFSAGLNLFGVETDGGRLPAASAVPDLSALWEAATEQGWTKEQRWKQIQDELNKRAYVVPPFGGGQISKSWKGIKAYLEGGSYGLDKNGEEILQYPVYKDDPDAAFWNAVRAALMGKNSLPEAQDWVNSGYDSLNAKQTAIYQDLLDAGIKDRIAFELIRRQEQITDTEGRAEKAKRTNALFEEDISGEAKAIVYYGFYATEKEQFQMDELAELGVDPGEIASLVYGLWKVGSNAPISHASVVQERLFNNSALTEEEKHIAMKYVLGKRMTTDEGNPSAYAKYLSAVETGLSNEQYMRLRAFGTDIDDYLELSDAGVQTENAVKLSMRLDCLEPNYGYDQVHWTQKGEVIMEMGLSESEQMAALSVVIPYESTYEKVKTGHDLGMNMKSYIDLKIIMPQFDEDGNASYTQQETEAAINALAGDDNPLFALTGTTPNGYTLTDREKAILWQLQNKSWKPNRNPFDREVGQMVYDILTAEDPSEAVSTAESGTAWDIANLLSKQG